MPCWSRAARAHLNCDLRPAGIVSVAGLTEMDENPYASPRQPSPATETEPEREPPDINFWIGVAMLVILGAVMIWVTIGSVVNVVIENR